MNLDNIFARLSLHYLPIILGIAIIIFPFFLLAIAISLNHIEPFLPFVSDLGVLPPEASLFSMIMNSGTLMLIFLAIIRFESTKAFIEDKNRNSLNDNKLVLSKWNTRSLISGICMAMGFGIVANFRNAEGVLVLSVHNIGAVFGFFSTVADMFFQSRAANEMSLFRIARLRLVLTISSLFLAITYNILSGVSFSLYSDALLNTERRLKWNSSQSGYYFHVTATSLEWILIMSLSPYFLSFVTQFKKYSLSKNLVIYKDINQNTVNSS